jgi:hypothetical protein
MQLQTQSLPFLLGMRVITTSCWELRWSTDCGLIIGFFFCVAQGSIIFCLSKSIDFLLAFVYCLVAASCGVMASKNSFFDSFASASISNLLMIEMILPSLARVPHFAKNRFKATQSMNLMLQSSIYLYRAGML